ncbi:uncharacterized protein rab44 isoform 2-T2 [Odontesthes bonariensis]|uniref:uncharacterized protein rab44 isoform X2 n=1 Tax=Odontesthes bonariensis TaxID=219752 RepID=UPI003F58B1EF
MNRRKLGSSRRNKGKRHAKDTENEPEAREDVEDDWGNKTLEVQTSAAAQLVMQEELSRGTEHSISASHDSLVVSPATPDYSEVEKPTISPEFVTEALMPNTGDLHACKSKPNLERTENYDCLDSEEIKENAHVGQSTSDCVSPRPVGDQLLINMQAANPSMYTEPDLESNKRDDTDLFRQDESLEGVDLRTNNEAWINSTEKVETAFGQMYERESHVKDDVKHSVGQTLHREGVFEVEKFNLSLQTLLSEVNAPLDSQLQDSSLSADEHTETGFGPFGNRRKLGSSRRNKGRQRVEECKEDILEKAEGVETLEKNNISMEMRATNQKELYQDTEREISSSVSPDSSMFLVSVPVESSAQTKCLETDLENFIPESENLPEDQDERETDINVKVPDESEEAEQQDVDKYDIPHSEDISSAHHSDDAVKEMQEDMVRQRQAHEIDYISETMMDDAAENPEIISGFSVSESFRVLERTRVDKVPETTKIQSETKTTNQDELSQDTEHGIGLSVSHDNSMFSASAPGHSSAVEGSTPKTYPETEKEHFILKSENLPEDQDERETDFNVEVLDKSTEAMPQEMDQSDTRHSELTKDADRSDDAVREEQEEDNHPTQMQEILHVDYSSETVTDNAPENSEVISAILIERAEMMNTFQSEFNNDNSATKQEMFNSEEKPDEHPTKQDTSEPLDHISDQEKVDSAPSQVHEFKDKVEGDIKPITVPLFHQEKEGLLSETDEIKPALSAFQTETTVSFDCQLEDSSDSVEAQNNTGFHQSSNRRKLGSSRRNKGKHNVKESATKTFHQTVNEVDGNASSSTSSEGALTAETAGQEKSMEIILEVEKMNASQTEEENVRFGTLVCTSELTTIGVHSTSAVDQRVIENSCCRQMPHEELPSVSLQTDTESEERHEHTELLRQDGNLQENSVFEPRVCPITPEIHTDPGQSVEKLSPEEEFPTKEEQLYDVSVAQQSEDAARTEHGQEIEPAQTQGMSQIDHTTAKARVNSEISRNVVERIEMAAGRNTDYPKPQIDDVERVESALGDAYEIEGQVKDSMNPSDEGTDHHTSKEVFSEICDSEYSLQSLHCEMKAPLDSQLQHSYTSFNPGGNSGAPGSSQEKSMEMKLEEMDKSDTPHTENITLHGQEKAYFGTVAGISELTTSSPAVELQLLKSNFRELPDDELPTVSSTTENKEKHEDTEMLRAFGNLHGNNLSSENVDLSVVPERTPEKSTPQDHNQVEYSVAQDTIPSEENVPSNGEQDEPLNLSEAAEALHLEDVVSEEHEEQFNPAQTREMCQINCATITEKNSPLQTQESDTDLPLDSQPLDNYQSFKDDTQSGLKPAGNRRKMGSSRRNKGRQQGKVIQPKQELKDAVVENTVDDKVTEMSAANTMRQEGLEELISVEKVNISSTVTGDENQEKLLEGTLYSHNVLENIVVATSDTNPSSDNEDSPESNKDLNEKNTKHVKEPDNRSHLTGCDTVKKDLTQSPQASVFEDDSDRQSTLYHDDIINPESGTVHVSYQEEGALPCDSDSQQTDNVTETTDCLTVEDCSTEVESSMDARGPDQDEVGEKGVHTAQKMENTSQEPAVDVSCERGISTTKDERNSLQEDSPSDYGESMQVKSKQRRRKMGSSRRTPLNRKEEEAKDNTDETEESSLKTEAGVRNLEEMEVVEELPLTAKVSPSENVQGTVEQQETDGNKTSHYDYKLKSSTSEQSNKSNVILALPPEQSTSVNQVTFNKVADERDERGNVDLCAEMSQQDDFTSTNVKITSDVAGRNESSFSQLMPPNSETNTSITGGSSVSFCEVIRSTQSDEDRPESVKLVKVQDTDKQKPSNWTEGTHLEEKSPSPNLNSPNRRRKLGSTRKNLSSRTKREDLHQNQELENEATEAVTATGDVTTESDPEMKEKDPQPDTEHKEGDSEKRKEKIIETVKISHVGESLLTPQAEQTAEESPISQSQSTESENQQTPSYLPSTSAKNDTESQSASGGRRKKFGSSRKPNMMHQSNIQAGREAKIGAQNENVVRGITEDGANKEQSSGLRKISEVGEGDEKETASFSTAEPVSKKTSTQPELSLAPRSQTQLSFGSPRGTDYDVVMVGDSCVGKSSFMKRAQSGKFSLDLPASVGLDSCIWTVIVEGKPVVLQLWDTAGQERFRSITRQIFHKARAFLLMYDITSSQSFSAISYWANSIQESAAENVTVLLLGNKSDHEQRRVKTQQGEILAKEYNFEFMECSAATGENVIEALETVARMLSQRADLREEATVLLKEPAQKKRSTCC